MTGQEELIREAIAYEASEAVDSRVVMAQMREKSRRSRWPTIGIIGLTVTAAAAAVIIPIAVNRTIAEPGTVQGGPQYVLLIRSGHSDGMERVRELILTRVETDGTISALDIPPGYDIRPSDPVNTMRLPMSNPKKILDTVEKLTGVRPDHYAAMNYDTLGRLATIVGGVEVCIKPDDGTPQSKGIPLSSLSPGRHTLSGEKVGPFLDTGFIDGNSNVLQSRQRAFLAGFAAKITKDNAVQLAREAAKSVQTDEGWDLVAFARRFQHATMVRTAEIPFNDETVELSPEGREQFIPEKVHEHAAKFFGGQQVPGAVTNPSDPDDRCVY